MLRLHRHEFRVKVTIGNQFRQVFHDMGLGCDRIGGHHIHVTKGNGLGSRN
jgi:hypothetical protein